MHLIMKYQDKENSELGKEKFFLKKMQMPFQYKSLV